MISTGDKVDVSVNNIKMTGLVVAVLPDYAWTGKTWYQVHGADDSGQPFTTIASSVVSHRGQLGLF